MRKSKEKMLQLTNKKKAQAVDFNYRYCKQI